VQNSSGVTAIVNGFVISNYDLDQRIALFIATSGVRPTTGHSSANPRSGFARLRMKSSNCRKRASRRINVSNAKSEALQNIAADNKLGVPQILNNDRAAGVRAATIFRQQISAQIACRRLVAARYGPDIQVTDQQLDEAMNG